MPSDLVVVAEYTNTAEAEMAKERLEELGITALVSADDCGGMEPQLQLIGGVQLMVLRENEDYARQALAGQELDGPIGPNAGRAE